MLVDIPKDIQQTLAVPDWDTPMDLDAYISRLPPPPTAAQLQRVADAIREVGGRARAWGLGRGRLGFWGAGGLSASGWAWLGAFELARGLGASG